MTTTMPDDLKAADERQRIIAEARPTWTFKNDATGEKVATHPKDWAREHRIQHKEFGMLMLGMSVKGWVFNTKWLMNDDELYRRAMKRRKQPAAPC